MASTIEIPPTVPEISPEQLKIMKIKHNAGVFERDFRSEPTSPTQEFQSLDLSAYANGHSHGRSSSSLMRRNSSRQVSSASRRASSFVHSHRSQMSMELSSKANSKFFALMDLMSTASREASSLKETWAHIISERESLARENEELLRRVEEATDIMERKEKEYHSHGSELVEKKRQVEKLLFELSSTLTDVTSQKKKVAERDLELNRIRTELHDLRSTYSRNHGDFDKTKAELEATIFKLRAAEEDRDNAKQDSQKHHVDLRALMREHTELKGKFSESSTKLETSRKENMTLSDRIKMWELEREEHLHEKDRLQEEAKRVKLRGDEAYRELSELNDKHERATREHNKLKDSLRELEAERDDYVLQIGNLRREVKTKSTDLEEADVRVSEIALKYEHIKREVVSVKEKLRDAEVERNELRSALDRSLEDHRLLVVERDQIKEDLDDERRKCTDIHRQISVLQESLRRAELSVTETRSEVTSLTERNRILAREGEETRHKHGQISVELSGVREQLAHAQAEIRTIAQSRDRAYQDLNEWKQKYEEMTETITEFRDDSGEFEMEIQNLRTLLRDAREQKERAISARHAADRERDEYVSKYEEKCRELERYEESTSSLYHGYSRSGGGGGGSKTFTRTVSSGTTVRNGGGENSGEGSGMFNSH